MSKKGNLNIDRKKLYIMDAIILIVLGAIDRLTKLYAVKALKDHPSRSVINGILEFHFLDNTGASFGLLKNEKAFFILISAIILMVIVYLFIRMPGKRKYIKAHIALSLIATGCAGNTLDRILYSYVVDFIYFNSINFPVFNVADIYISVATVMIIFFLFFCYKEDDLNFLRFKEKKLRDIQ